MENFIGLIELKNLLIIFAMFSIPGWFLLSITRFWENWAPLQRWILAVSLSIVFYPILFYFSRLILPNFRIGLNKSIVIGLIFLLIIILKERQNIKNHMQFDKFELIAIGIIFLTLLTRFLLLSTHPYPAWSDSLHHTLLTKLVAVNGQLPYSLEPYEPVNLSMYHLGLYSITGTFTFLSSVPAHTALQWISQVFNGLCGIGIYLFLDKYVSRKAAIIGLIVAGLFSFQPNWYFNWGRFTQLSAQSILVTALVLNIEVITHNKISARGFNKIFEVIFASLLNSGMFLLHFRVAVFYFLFIAIVVMFEFIRSYKLKNLISYLSKLGSIALFSIIFISPSIFQAFTKYLEIKMVDVNQSISAEAAYYHFPLSSYFSLGLPVWLYVITLTFLLVGLLRKNEFMIKILIWTLGLLGVGYLYLLQIPLLMVTNLGAILIMLYIPSALIIGIGFEEFRNIRPSLFKKDYLFNGFLIASLFFGYVRVFDIDESRFFLSSDDIEAMSWIKENLPEDAKIGINTVFWLSNHPHGIDSGYWIPYFTDRKITTGSMLFNIGSKSYTNRIIHESHLVEEFYNTLDTRIIPELCYNNIDYFFLKNYPNEKKVIGLENIGYVSIEFNNHDTIILKIICK
jgi:hypothetical protein